MNANANNNIIGTNGDGTNDLFSMTSSGVAEFKGAIFDRGGLKLVEMTDINIGWDGLYKGAPSATGIYTYSCIAITLGGREIEKKGTVNLLK